MSKLSLIDPLAGVSFMDVRSPEFARMFAARIAERAQRHPTVRFDFGTAIGVVGTLQLALRHPGMALGRGGTAEVMRKLVDDIIQQLAGGDVIILKGLLAGDNPASDVRST